MNHFTDQGLTEQGDHSLRKFQAKVGGEEKPHSIEMSVTVSLEYLRSRADFSRRIRFVKELSVPPVIATKDSVKMKR